MLLALQQCSRNAHHFALSPLRGVHEEVSDSFPETTCLAG